MSLLHSITIDPALLALHNEWHSLLSSMHNFLLRAGDTDTRDFTQDLTQTSVRRMSDFNVHSVRLKERDISRVDMMFVLQCYNICCMSPPVRMIAILTDAKEISAQLCLIGSRHTKHARAQSIDSDSVAELMHMCASWIVQYGSSDPEAVTDMLMSIGDKVTMRKSTAEKLDEYMNMPHLIHLQTKEHKQQIADSIKRREEEESPLAVFDLANKRDEEMNEEVTEEEDMDSNSQRGRYWLTCVPVIVVALLPMASRIFHQISLEQRVMSLYPIADVDPFVYPPAALVNLRSIVISRCTTSAGDQFVPKFREAVFKWSLPMGALSMRYRNLITQFQESDAANLSEDELGMDVAQAIYNMMNVPLNDIASDKSHELYDMLSFYTLVTIIENRCGIIFDPLIIMSCDLILKYDTLNELVECYEHRRPRIVCVMQRTWIHDQRRWYRCDGLVDAVLKLLVMMKFAWQLLPTEDASKASRYKNQYKSRSIKSISDELLGAGLFTQLPHWLASQS